MLPDGMLRSEAARTLSPGGRIALEAMVSARRPDQNGNYTLVAGRAKEYGIGSRTTLAAALRELVARGLVEVTRPAPSRLDRVPTLYAVTWHSVQYRAAQPLDRAEPASHAYLHWKPPPKSTIARHRGARGRYATPERPAVEGATTETEIRPPSGQDASIQWTGTGAPQVQSVVEHLGSAVQRMDPSISRGGGRGSARRRS